MEENLSIWQKPFSIIFSKKIDFNYTMEPIHNELTKKCNVNIDNFSQKATQVEIKF